MYKIKKTYWLLFLIAVSIITFIFISSEVVEHDPIGPDTVLLNFLHTHANPFLTRFFKLITATGGVKGVLVLVAVTSAYFYYVKRYHAIYLLLSAVALTGLVNYVLKTLFARDRPELWQSFITEYYYSYPSGHAMASSAVAFTAICVAWRTRFRWHAVIIGSLYMLLVGISRLYLGVHYPSDVVSGWLVSFILVIILSSLLLNYPFDFKKKNTGRTST